MSDTANLWDDVEVQPTQETPIVDAASDSVFDILDADSDVKESDENENIAADGGDNENDTKGENDESIEETSSENEVTEDEIEEESSSEDKESSEEDKPKDKQSDKESEEDVKLLTAKVGEEDVQIAADAKFMHKVDGEDVEVPLQELLNNYSGKVAYDKKFQELSAEKKEYTAERQEVEQYIDKFAEKVHNKDVLGAMAYFAEFAGIDGLQFKNQLRSEMKPFFDQQAGLSEQEIETARIKEENDYFKQQKESEAIQSSEKASQEALNRDIDRIQEAHGIDEDAFLDVYESLKATTNEQVTLQMIENQIIENQSVSKSAELLDASGVELDDKDAAVKQLSKLIVENKDFGDDDWAEVIKQAYSKPAKKTSKVSGKVKKQGQKTETNTKPVLSKVDAFFFDDLDD